MIVLFVVGTQAIKGRILTTAPTAEQEWTVNDMRLIDADVLFAEIENDYKNANGMRRRGLSEALDSIADAPTIDAVPVVRCKDCKHLDKEDCAMSFDDDRFLHCWARCDDFCSYGERKEDEGNV